MRATLLAIVFGCAFASAASLAFAEDAATNGSATGGASADGPQWRHASALTGDPGYPEDFTHFDYVNSDAPKAGTVRLSDPSGYDSFNPVLQRGNPAPGLTLIYDELMAPAYDEINISGSYGLIADKLRYPDDFSWVEYHINPDARWHDGTPITPDDVIWSLEVTKEADPTRAFYYSEVTGAEKVDDQTVRFNFAHTGNRELPHIVGQLEIMPKHWWTGTGPGGKPRDIMSGTLEPPLGSGPYKIASFEPNRFVEYERVDDYWAKDLPSMKGTNNFDKVRYDTYRDQTVALEAFKADQYDFRSENSASNWALRYDFPARKRGDVILETFPDEGRGVMQAFVMNMRLPKFQDERVRRALNLLYDFESQKETIYYGQYERIDSYFSGTELASSGLPEGRELEILEEVRDLVPETVFSEPYENPVGGSPQKVRENMREAVALFREAGYEIRNGKMVNAETGAPFTIEMIENNPASERSVLPYKQSLGRIGVDLTLRIVDTSQYINRIRNRDFEMSTLAWGQSLSPGNEQLDFWGSKAADQPQSQNYAGIKDPGIDALIEKVIRAKDRDDLVAATRALDRVLLAHNYVVPQFTSTEFRTARWNRFGHPDNIPPYTHGFPTIWWWDQDKAAKIGEPS
ncbi:extracellular solute-binding protein [Acuticoccus sp. M5D2P5]|uniref:extracellular solute-binding protein n=1 Tax=Acuticoccus kalidii TaxID=2910977 RepID=UPI001F42FC16|nr:extracellular solute-binding protein [Acuticoccus kalidii]MCF3933620.1 extracellular solute-binding protein [Acuticoccus kalidii]